jgi:hypothetical protein
MQLLGAAGGGVGGYMLADKLIPKKPKEEQTKQGAWMARKHEFLKRGQTSMPAAVSGAAAPAPVIKPVAPAPSPAMPGANAVMSTGLATRG